MRQLRSVLVPAVCLAALVTAGCSGSSDGDGSTPTTSATTTSSSPSATPSPSVTALTSTCGSALSAIDVNTAAGQPVIGQTSFVVGEADASIGRLAYINCRYGLPRTTPAAGAAAPVPGVEIGVSLYDSAKRATDRVASTVDDYVSSGSRAETVTVGAVEGTVLVGGGPPTLVVADGPRTVAVSVSRTVSTGFPQLVALAELALDKVT